MFSKTAFILFIFAFIVLFAISLYASSALLFLEAQGVGGYSSVVDDVIWHSAESEDSMQKPGIGFDYLQKISGDTGDIATIALQGRGVYDENKEHKAEAQLYNAYIKFKTPVFDIWAGHNRPAFGLSSYLDSHALLLQTIAMKGFGYDRDWGSGLYGEFEWGDIQASLTTGSGMPVYFRGNYLASARASFGVLSQDNYNIGVSAAYGEPLVTMGYHLMMDDPVETQFAGVDANYLLDNFEFKVECAAGKTETENIYALFGRLGYNLLEESRLKFEIQPVYFRTDMLKSYELSAGATYIATSDITLRSMYQYIEMTDDHRVVLQFYYYTRVL